jgi:His-Xaa-Ser system protein HxsD
MNSQLTTFDSKVFSLTVIKEAAYRYLNVFAVDITAAGDQIQCVLNFISPVSDEKCRQMVNDFKTEVLDQDLRQKLRAETEAVRNVILAHAFSKTGLISNEPLPRD